MATTERPASDGTVVRRRWTKRHNWFVRRWGGWRRKRKDIDSDGVFDGANIDGDDFIGFAIILGAIVIGVLAWFTVLPVLFALVDVLVIVVVAVVGIVGRVAFKRPWTIEATHNGVITHEWNVVGWNNSKKAIQSISQAFATNGDVTAAASEAGAVEQHVPVQHGQA